MDDLYYSDYIELDKILNSQHPKSFESPEEGNDEMLFIIIHQSYELWFKQILFELDYVLKVFQKDTINDNSEDLNLVLHRLRRVIKIFELLNHRPASDTISSMSNTLLQMAMCCCCSCRVSSGDGVQSS